MWVAMLSSFSKHLKEKGWFDICAIAMDERPMEVIQKTLKVIRKADPDFKVSLAGNYHAEIEPDLYDYCIVIGQNFPEEVRLRRAAENKRTNYYTCCTEQAFSLFSLIRLYFPFSQIPDGGYLSSRAPEFLQSSVRNGYSYGHPDIQDKYLHLPNCGNGNRAAVPMASCCMPNANNRPGVS